MSNNTSDSQQPSMNTQDSFEVDGESPIKHSADELRQQTAETNSNKKSQIPILALGSVVSIALIAAGAYYYTNIYNSSTDIKEKKIQTAVEQTPTFDPQQDRINRLLTKAELFMQQGQYIQPIGQNAFGKYEAILRMDDKNIQAIAGIRKIAEHFIQQALGAIDENNLDKARIAIEHAKSVYSDAEGITDVEQTLAALLASSQASFAENARIAAAEKAKIAAAKKAAQRQAWLAKQAKNQAEADKAQNLANQQAAELAAEQAALEKLAEEARLRQEAESNAAQQRLAKLKVNGLLNKADTYFKRQEFYAPEEENALAKYSRVIAIEPNNKVALQGIDKVIDQMLPTIETQLNNKHFSNAKNLFDLAKTANPKHLQLIALGQTQGW